MVHCCTQKTTGDTEVVTLQQVNWEWKKGSSLYLHPHSSTRAQEGLRIQRVGVPQPICLLPDTGF